VSYGGSSFLSTMIAGGILLNISRYRESKTKIYRENDSQIN
jgi:cell division protein FtsW (lipid II flippase)